MRSDKYQRGKIIYIFSCIFVKEIFTSSGIDQFLKYLNNQDIYFTATFVDLEE